MVLLDVSVENIGRTIGALIPAVMAVLAFTRARADRKLAAKMKAVPPSPAALPPVDVLALTSRLETIEKSHAHARAAWMLDDARAEVARLQKSELAWKVEEARTSEALMQARQALERMQRERDQAVTELGQLKLSLVPKEPDA